VSLARSAHGQKLTPPAIAGIGAVSGYGWGEKCLRAGLYSGRSAVRPRRGFLPWAPRVPAWLALADDEGAPSAAGTRAGRALRFAVHEALSDAADRGWRRSEMLGLIHGADALEVTWAELTDELGIGGPAMSMTAGAASGATALLTAKCWIEGGVAEDVLVVCSDLPLTPERIQDRAASYRVDSPAACLPFQQGSSGCNPGEAVVALVVARSSPSAYARVLGGAVVHAAVEGERVDAGRLRYAMERAMADAEVSPADISYFNANGAGDPATDALEAEVADEVLDSVAGVYSLKPLVGDCGAAAGTVELLGALYGFSTGVVPAPARLAPGHPRLLDGPTASVDGVVVKASIGNTGECGVVVVAPVD